MSPRQPYPLRELAETLRYELDLQGIPTSVSEVGFPAPRSDLVYVLVDPRAYVRVEGIDTLPDEAVLRRTILLSAERPEALDDDEYVGLLRRGGAVFELEGRTVAAMRRLGIAGRGLKPGYSKLRDHYDGGRARPIDVMFLGVHSPRRTEVLASAARLLAGHNCLLHLARDRTGTGDGPTFYGASRWSLLAQTKIVLNIHRDERTEFEWLRATDAIHAGAAVVSEQSSALGVLEPGKHLLVAGADSLPYVVDTLLRDEPRLRQLRGDAYERLRSWSPFALSASVFRAAIIEVLGSPLHSGVALRGGYPREAAAEREAAPREAELETQLSETRAGLKEAREELFAIHSELVQIRRQGGSLRREMNADGAVEPLLRSPAWAARRQPRVTVLVAVHDDQQDLARTLDSVAGSSTGDFELVVAGAGTRAGPLTERWMRRHPRIPMSFVDDHLAEGRGAARNLGLLVARGESILVLDPGATIFAHCLQRLADTLASMDETAFVYPLIEVESERHWFVSAGGDSLLNAFGWEPDRLRGGNPVQAPYLIRAHALRALHGFATDLSLDGFEDYDLWCRVARRGWRGQLLGQVLASRVELPGSTCLATLSPIDGPARRALVARAPEILAGAVGG